tara:strand:- start:4445 stop:4984 length:540 start_codon:yes stop_codon:yes gene_type:complete
MDLREFFSVWKKVFSNWKYLASTIMITLVFYSLNVLIASYNSLVSFYKQSGFLKTINLFLNFFIGFKSTVLLYSFISLVLISILFGLLFSLIAYKTKIIKSISGKIGFIGTTGIFLGILAPGCAACGVGLLSLFGISAAFLTFLPFGGLELSILSIIILSGLIFKITKDISEGIKCKID